MQTVNAETPYPVEDRLDAIINNQIEIESSISQYQTRCDELSASVSDLQVQLESVNASLSDIREISAFVFVGLTIAIVGFIFSRFLWGIFKGA